MDKKNDKKIDFTEWKTSEILDRIEVLDWDVADYSKVEEEHAALMEVLCNRTPFDNYEGKLRELEKVVEKLEDAIKVLFEHKHSPDGQCCIPTKSLSVL